MLVACSPCIPISFVIPVLVLEPVSMPVSVSVPVPVPVSVY